MTARRKKALRNRWLRRALLCGILRYNDYLEQRSARGGKINIYLTAEEHEDRALGRLWEHRFVAFFI